MEWQDEIFAEKSLWSVFLKSQGIIGSRFNSWTVSLVAIALLLVQVTWYINNNPPTSTLNIITLRDWAGVGVSVSSGILGFLVTGFSIFATMTRNELFVALARIPHKKGEISRLKFIFFNFLIIFINYMAFLGCCLFIELFLSENMPLTKLLGRVLEGYPSLIYSVSSFGLVLVGAWFAAILLMLKSFIWNLYQSVLLVITAGDALREYEEQRKLSRPHG